MTAVARTETRVRGSTCDPVITVTSPVDYLDPDKWDRSYLLDVASSAVADGYDLCGHSQLVSAICQDYIDLDSNERPVRDRLISARHEVDSASQAIAQYRQGSHILESQLAEERNRHQETVLELEMARHVISDTQVQLLAERAERIRLQALASKLSAQLAETSKRLIDVSFDHAAHVIRQLGGEDLRGQSMVFDTAADTTVVDVVVQ